MLSEVYTFIMSVFINIMATVYTITISPMSYTIIEALFDNLYIEIFLQFSYHNNRI